MGVALLLLDLDSYPVVLHALQLLFQVLCLSFQSLDLGLLAAVLRYQVSVLAVDPLPLGELHLQILDFLLLDQTLFILEVDYVLLSLVRSDQLVDSSQLFPVAVLLLLHFVLLLLELQQLHLEVVLVFALALQLHRLVSEGLLEVGEVVHVAGLAAELRIDASAGIHSHFLLLLQKHVLFHQRLLELLAQAEALVDVDSELNLDLLRLRKFDVPLQLLDQSILFLNLQLQVSVILLELADDEGLGKVMALAALSLRA